MAPSGRSGTTEDNQRDGDPAEKRRSFAVSDVRNVLLVNERRQRITEADSVTFLHVLGTLDIGIDRSPDEAL